MRQRAIQAFVLFTHTHSLTHTPPTRPLVGARSQENKKNVKKKEHNKIKETSLPKSGTGVASSTAHTRTRVQMKSTETKRKKLNTPVRQSKQMFTTPRGRQFKGKSSIVFFYFYTELYQTFSSAKQTKESRVIFIYPADDKASQSFIFYKVNVFLLI